MESSNTTILRKLFSNVTTFILLVGVAFLVFGIVLGFQNILLLLSTNPQAVFLSITTFTTIFLGIFIEAAPFLLMGTLASGVVEVLLKKDSFTRYVPRNVFLGTIFGSLLGFGFPVCECGVVPLTRRLFAKGLPVHVGIAFLLASPVVNPIVIASTMAAFGFGKILLLRIGLSILIATLTGLVFAFHKRPHDLLLPTVAEATFPPIEPMMASEMQGGINRWKQINKVAEISVSEFFEMGKFLIIGALLAAFMQTFIPRSVLLSFNQGALIPVLAMISLAVLLSICSTVDSFIALAFVSSFANGSILAFLVFGAMVDIKSTLLFMRVFQRRTVLYIILLPLLMTILATTLINIFFPV